MGRLEERGSSVAMCKVKWEQPLALRLRMHSRQTIGEVHLLMPHHCDVLSVHAFVAVRRFIHQPRRIAPVARATKPKIVAPVVARLPDPPGAADMSPP